MAYAGISTYDASGNEMVQPSFYGGIFVEVFRFTYNLTYASEIANTAIFYGRQVILSISGGGTHSISSGWSGSSNIVIYANPIGGISPFVMPYSRDSVVMVYVQ